MAESDTNREALRQVERATDSEPVNGEDLLRSPELKRKYREIKKQLAAPLPEPPGKKPVK